jgi:NAD(P)H-nitrite reductase large subunit
MPIDRCVCFDVPFETLDSIARCSGAETIEALQEEIAFGHDCCRCHPYVTRMLATGQTVFSEIIREEEDISRSR